MLEPGTIVELVPEQLVPGGDALARLDGLPVFVRGIYPGDLARVRITETKKGFARGELVGIVHASAERRAAPCPVADECGGCDWTALRLDRQLAWKRRILVDALRRVGKIDPARLPAIGIHPSPLRYRLRSRLQVGEGGELGFYALRTNRVVPLPEECEVVGPEVIANLDALRELAASARPSAIETLESEGTLEALAVGPDEAAPESAISVGPHRFALSIRSFFQVNRHLLGTLHALVMQSAGRTEEANLAWDLYGGVGFFALPLAERFARVVSVESSSESHRWGARNARRGVLAVREDVARFLARERERPDFVLADPPRAGLAPEVTDGIAASGAGRICYLSCDPVTFSRDASRLARRGWTLATIDLIDLFPNTHHIETLASFERA